MPCGRNTCDSEFEAEQQQFDLNFISQTAKAWNWCCVSVNWSSRSICHQHSTRSSICHHFDDKYARISQTTIVQCVCDF